MASYCEAAVTHPVHGPYHDNEYGFPNRDEDVLFERLVLEINQAGLSWLTILNKRAGFRKAYRNFDVDRVARFAEGDRTRLLNDASIIRNRLKIDAAIENAKVVVGLRKSHGGFASWLDSYHPQPKPDWVKVFRSTFRFTGGEIVGEFLISLGYLEGAHESWCPAYQRIVPLNPPWRAANSSTPDARHPTRKT